MLLWFPCGVFSHSITEKCRLEILSLTSTSLKARKACLLGLFQCNVQQNISRTPTYSSYHRHARTITSWKLLVVEPNEAYENSTSSLTRQETFSIQVNKQFKVCRPCGYKNPPFEERILVYVRRSTDANRICWVCWSFLIKFFNLTCLFVFARFWAAICHCLLLC